MERGIITRECGNERRTEMKKLMDTDPYNRAMPKKLIGEDMFGDTYSTCLAICQKQTDCDDCPIQEAFARLRQYEQTGLTPEQVMELKERDTPTGAVFSRDFEEQIELTDKEIEEEIE